MLAVQVRPWKVGLTIGVALLLMSGVALAGVPAWTTYRHDAGRSGIDPDSSSPVAPSRVWQSAALDGAIYGQPLVYGSRVYVATENDSVYALNEATGAIVWQRNLGTPVDNSVIPCTGNIQPVGITSTPVIDPTTGRIYVVADTWNGSTAASVQHEMFALNLADGSVAVGPVPVDPPGSTHTDQLQRTSLALDAGKVIIGYGGNSGDCGNYHGWEVAVREDGTGPLQTFESDSQPGDSQGAIWGSGNAPAIDSAGDVWISTGNGNSNGTFDYSESVIRLDSNLNLLDWWAPSNWSALDGSDLDIGSTMPMPLPAGLVFEIGKDGIGYLLSAASLGQTGGAPVYQHAVCPSGSGGGDWGGGVYYNGVIYVTCANGSSGNGMHALSLNTAARSFGPVSGWTINANAIGPPIVAGGLIWSADYNGSTLYGLDPRRGTTTFSDPNLNGFEHFMTPSAAGGLLFVANNDASASGDDVTAFRIASTPPPSSTATTLVASVNPAGAGQSVSLTAIVSPAPDAGTVAFTDGGSPISGCGAVPVSVATGQATCTTSFSTVGTHSLLAGYSGDAYYLASNASLSETVTAAPGGGGRGPGGGGGLTISHLRVTLVHRRLRLTLTLTGPARVVVVISRLVPGRMVGHRCRARARHGRRCRAALYRGTLRLVGRTGSNNFKPGMRRLPPGRYAVKVTAASPAGQRSRSFTVLLTVP